MNPSVNCRNDCLFLKDGKCIMNVNFTSSIFESTNEKCIHFRSKKISDYEHKNQHSYYSK